MRVEELCPAVAERVQFTFRHRKKVPSEPGCYVLATFEGDILYVGLSDDLKRRFGQHRDNDDKCEVTPLGRAFWFYFLEMPEKEIYRVERTWLNQYTSNHGEFPVFNRVMSPVT